MTLYNKHRMARLKDILYKMIQQIYTEFDRQDTWQEKTYNEHFIKNDKINHLKPRMTT